jgi:hypothetical protein
MTTTDSARPDDPQAATRPDDLEATARPKTGEVRVGRLPLGPYDQPDAPPGAGPQLLWLAGTVGAPTALLTALLFYFGRQHAFGYYRYFGVNFTVLDLSTEDYLVKSADGLFVPLIAIAVLSLLALAGLRLLHARQVAHPDSRLALVAALGILTVAVGLLVVATVALLDPDAFIGVPGLPGLLLAVGALLGAYARKLLRAVLARRTSRATTPAWTTIAEWAGVFVLVSLGLFWAVGDYSYSVGTTRAQQTAAELAAEPVAVLYSAERLSLRAPGVEESPCADPEAAYRFRYHGLKLVQQSGDHYFFLPAGWSPTDGVAIVIPRSDSLRLEFTSAPAAARAAQRPGC